VGVVGAVDLARSTFAAQTELLFDLFEEDEPSPRPSELVQLANAIRGAQVPAPCPLGELTITSPMPDDMWRISLLNARTGAVLSGIERLGVPVAGRVVVKVQQGSLGNSDTAFQAALDEKPPRLETRSRLANGTSLPNGSKVNPGDQIVVTMTASDDPDPWPTGLKGIQLVADSDGGRFIAAETYEPCAEPRERQVVATYVVPANPPPMVRLTALAEDWIGQIDTDVGEFPTADWQGTIAMKVQIGGMKSTSGVTFAFDVAPDGSLNGRARAHIQGETTPVATSPPCTSLVTASPNQFDVELGGRRNGDTFEIALSVAGSSRRTITMECAPGGVATSTEALSTNGLDYLATAGLHPEGAGTPLRLVYRVQAQNGAANLVSRQFGAQASYQYEIKLHATR
jgi:hypothetical protein